MDEPFTMPLPPPPPGAPRPDVLFFASRDSGDERDDEDLMFRRVPREIAQRFRAGAGGRGLTHAQYLTALVELHAALRARADAGDETAGAELERLGLTSVTV
jgi:hypothetical protein